MSIWLVFAIIVVAVAVTVGCQALIRRRVGEDVVGEIERGGTVYEYIFTAFSVLLAFVVLESFDQYNDARGAAESEAVGVIEQSRTADGFPPENARQLDSLLLCYARAVVHQEWPRMADGETSDAVDHWVVALRGEAREVPVRGGAESSFFLKFLDEQDERIEGRQNRIAEATREVPPAMWFVLLLGALLTIGWGVFYIKLEGHARVQAVLGASITALAVASILLVWSLDHPYEGTGRIEPGRMEHAIETIESEHRGADSIEALPCDERGSPLDGSAA